MRYPAIGAGAAALAFAVFAACNEQTISPGVQPDLVPPSVSIDKTAGDTMDIANGLQFTVNASDNLGLRVVSVLLEGGLDGQLDSTFSSQVTSLTLPFDIRLPDGSAAGGWILITAAASDGNNNGALELDSVFLKNEDALIVQILNPSVGALTSPGKQLPIAIRAAQREGVKRVGYLLAGGIIGGDSIGDLATLPQDTTFADTLTIPAAQPEGFFTVQGFAVDSADRRVSTSPLTVAVQLVTNDTEPPSVTVDVAQRVEVDDFITVTATDPSGITEIGWEARDLNGVQIGGDSTTLSGNLTDVIEIWNLNFSFSELPQAVVVTGFAVDGAGNRANTATTPAPPALVQRPDPTWIRLRAQPVKDEEIRGGGR
jgi:hypothetical protein